MEKNAMKSFACRRLAHKFAVVLRSTASSRASCFPRELVSFDPRHVTRSPPIGKRSWDGKFSNSLSFISHALSEIGRGYFASLEPRAASLFLRNDKGNGVVVMNRNAYEQGIFAIISVTSNFKVIDSYITKGAQILLRALKNKSHLDKDTWENLSSWTSWFSTKNAQGSAA